MINLIKKLTIIVFIATLSTTAISIEPQEFIQTTVDKASKILSNKASDKQKIESLKLIAIETVDVKGIGMYTLGKYRKTLTEEQKEIYSKLFKDYFLKSFSNRLVEWTDPQIIVNSQEVLNANYTMVNSTLKATNERPEIKIDWRVYTKVIDKPLIRDVVIEGLSLGRTQKEEFSSIINSNDGDIDILFKTLEDFINS